MEEMEDESKSIRGIWQGAERARKAWVFLYKNSFFYFEKINIFSYFENFIFKKHRLGLSSKWQQ